VNNGVTDEIELHKEAVTPLTPPTVFGATRGVYRFLTFGLPSEMISLFSLMAGAALFAILSLRETERFFFRMPTWWSPLSLSIPALLFSLLIAWVGSRRPGPLLPRVWVAFLAAVNASFIVVELASGMMKTPPLWLVDPFPLQPLALSAAVSTFVLLARVLFRTHPLNHSVQLIAPVSMFFFLLVAGGVSWRYVTQQVDAERHTLETLASRLDMASTAMRAAAHFDYSTDGEEDEEQQLRVESALNRLIVPDRLSLPDSRRWAAASVLERGGQLPPGRLTQSVHDLIDAIAEVMTPDMLPEVRGARFGWDNRNEKYVESPNRRFERSADIVLRYYTSAAAWLPILERVQQGPVNDYASARQRDVDNRIRELRKYATTAWIAMRLTGDSNAVRPPGTLADVLNTALAEAAQPIGNVPVWQGLGWRRSRDLARATGPTCEVTRPLEKDVHLIPVPDDQLTDEERLAHEHGTSYYMGRQFTARSMMRCFAYHAPYNGATDPDDLIVVEFRVIYEQHRQLSSSTHCQGLPCGSGIVLPDSTVPQSVTLIVDVPGNISDKRYGDEISATLESVLAGKVGKVERNYEAQPGGRQALRFLLYNNQVAH
jgi:hypothetical protein